MSYQLDEISRIIGNMQSDLGHIRTRTDEANGKIDTLVTQSLLNETSVKAAHRRIDDIEPEHKELINAKHRTKGAMVAYGSVGGIVTLFLGKVVEKFFT